MRADDHSRRHSGRPRISVRVFSVALFFLLMAGTILFGCILNSVFLEKYYVSERQKDLIRVYGELRSATVSDILETDDFDYMLQYALRRNNVSLLVMDSSTRTIKVWSADVDLLEARLYANIFGLTADAADQAEEDADSSLYQEDVVTRTLETAENYTIQIVEDADMGTRSMEMWGPLSESSFFLLRSPMEDIRSSAVIATRFFGYVGMITALLGTLLVWWLSGRITKPIQQMTGISMRMKQLDFSAKYADSSLIEIDMLGKNMNELSGRLESTISALRTANNDLQRDLDRRNRQEEMRQDFLSNVTHELKTPLALIRGYAEGLQDGIVEDPESRDFYLETIVEESEKMNTIVQRTLLLNQLEFGDSTVSMERFDIAAMIRNYLSSASLLARQEGVELYFLQQEPVYVWGDPFLIEEVLQNYYSNALHHVQPAASASGGTGFPDTQAVSGGDVSPGDPDVSGTADPQSGGRRSGSDEGMTRAIDIRCEIRDDVVRVTVFNTGRPIPKDALPHVWEKFYKVDKARTRAYGGSGVGLSIVKAIMDLHHRGYGADNYENGVAFWFELDHSGEVPERMM